MIIKSYSFYVAANSASSNQEMLAPANMELLGVSFATAVNVSGASPTDGTGQGGLVLCPASESIAAMSEASSAAREGRVLAKIYSLTQRKADTDSLMANQINFHAPLYGRRIDKNQPITFVLIAATGYSNIGWAVLTVRLR